MDGPGLEWRAGRYLFFVNPAPLKPYDVANTTTSLSFSEDLVRIPHPAAAVSSYRRRRQQDPHGAPKDNRLESDGSLSSLVFKDGIEGRFPDDAPWSFAAGPNRAAFVPAACYTMREVVVQTQQFFGTFVQIGQRTATGGGGVAVRDWLGWWKSQRNLQAQQVRHGGQRLHLEDVIINVYVFA